MSCPVFRGFVTITVPAHGWTSLEKGSLINRAFSTTVTVTVQPYEWLSEDKGQTDITMDFGSNMSLLDIINTEQIN